MRLHRRKVFFALAAVMLVLLCLARNTVFFRQRQFSARPDEMNIDGRFLEYIKWNPLATRGDIEDLVLSLSEKGKSRRDRCEALLGFTRNLPLDASTSINSVLHGVLAFGPDHPVKTVGGSIRALEFLKNYYRYLPVGIGKISPRWIVKTEGDCVVTVGIPDKVIQDHFSQLSATCALWGVPENTTFCLKSGEEASLAEILETEMRYADPLLRDPNWITISVAYRRPNLVWRNCAARRLTSIDFLATVLSTVPGHLTCGHTHPTIAAAYAIVALERQGVATRRNKIVFDRVRTEMDEYVELLRTTMLPDGSISRGWYAGKSIQPCSSAEALILNGHALECLSVYLPAEKLSADWVGKCIDCVIQAACDCAAYALEHDEAENIDYPALCHAARAINVYLDKTQHAVTADGGFE